MKCDECGKNLRKVNRSLEMAEPDGDETDGQLADYFAALETGEAGDWGYGEVEYFCKNCQSSVGIIMDTLNDLNSLIKAWHIKATQQEDYFSKYVFEYLSFVAHLKNNLFIEELQDRKAIQALKRSNHLRDSYLRIVAQSAQLKEAWRAVIEELKARPLHNSSHDFDLPEIDRWWNSRENIPNPASDLEKGIIHHANDWENMVEYWIAVRNNLFHGGKNPNLKRDQFLVKHAYLTMSPFMDFQVQAVL